MFRASPFPFRFISIPAVFFRTALLVKTKQTNHWGQNRNSEQHNYSAVEEQVLHAPGAHGCTPIMFPPWFHGPNYHSSSWASLPSPNQRESRIISLELCTKTKQVTVLAYMPADEGMVTHGRSRQTNVDSAKARRWIQPGQHPLKPTRVWLA
jgi:hypothetical protein